MNYNFAADFYEGNYVSINFMYFSLPRKGKKRKKRKQKMRKS